MTPLLSTLKHTLTQRLREHTPATLLIGLSGGVDSVVLLHALVGLRDEQAMELPPLAAMHINALHADLAICVQACVAKS